MKEQNFIEKPLVIRASAGTGKTYRLSLEFINILLKYRVNFDEIIVITFTKKATAEIRERIFKQLYEIIADSEEGKELKHSIQQNINSDIKFNSEEIDFLQDAYKNMITNKAAVKINTIDSFVNTVFSGIIAPYHNITDFSIDNKINNEILPEIYEYILQTENLQNYENIFLQAKRRNLEQFKELVISIIENRWLFEFIDLDKYQQIDIDEEKNLAFSRYLNSLKIFLDKLQTEILNYTKPAKVNDFLKKNFKDSVYSDDANLNNENISTLLFDILSNLSYLEDNYKLLLNNSTWNGRKIKSEELNCSYSELQNDLAEYFYYHKALIEQFNLISLAASILNIYDEIKFRDKIFTHSDISFYTFKFLYDPQLSIVDKGNVLNIFYEQLSYNSRFILIDEFQDTSILQWSIFFPMLKEICSGVGQKDYGKVIVVGDEKQAIYGWRGGERKLLTDFEMILNEKVEFDLLSTSYRSKPILMKWLNKLFKSNHLKSIFNWYYTEIDSAKSEGGFVQVDWCNGTEDDQKLEKAEIYHEYVLQNILPKIQNNKINPAETAIIMRTNKDLTIMAQALTNTGIDFTLEMTGSLFQHKAIKPIIFLLNFLVYEDVMELIKFLRSELVLMNAIDLKNVISAYQAADSINDFLQDCEIHEYLQRIYKLKNSSFSILFLLKTILEEFGVNHVFDSEIDLKNLQRFLEVAADFERSTHEYTKDVSGFLQYCRALADKDEYSQIGQSLSNSIKLLTIHKAKGLQFETVFAIFNVTAKLGGNNSGLKLYYKFPPDFRSLADFSLTYNYDKILKSSNQRNLVEYVENRNLSDELNNIYVALTRAKSNLFILLHYNKKGNIEKFCKDLQVENSAIKLLAKTIYLEFHDQLIELSAVSHQFKIGTTFCEPEKEEKNEPEKLELPDIFKICKPEWQETEDPNIKQLATEFMINKNILIGNIVHDFLSCIYYNTKKENELARKQIISKYGSLMQKEELENIINKINIFLKENPYYFDNNQWDRVFNEFIIFDENGRELRIDRMMLNKKEKEILIIDYKTGSIKDEDQLENYKTVVKSLPIVKEGNYNIKTKYVQIEISSDPK